MSKLDELIRELCPDGVEYKRFDEVCTLNARIGWQRLTKAEYMSKGDYLLITGTDFTETHEIDYSTCVYVTEERYKQDSKIQLKNGDILITKDGTLGKVAQVKGLEMPATLNGGVFVVRCKDGSLENRFILHYLLSNHFQSVVEQQKTGSTISHLTQTLFSRLMIPIPPLEIQREIVRILDDYTKNVTELQRQLAAETTARKTQYTYYRDELLTNNYNSKIKRLEECCDSIADGDHQAPPKADSGIPFITISDIDERHEINFNVIKYVPDEYYNRLADKRRPQKGDVLYTVVGSYGIPVYVKENKKFVFQRHIAILRPNNAVIDSRYLYHAMNGTAFHRQADLAAKGAAQKTIGLASLAKMTVPVPPLDVQNRIVNVLDNFEKVCSDLNIGLPAEIEARQKQYEYYRDKLLTFVETGNTILSRAEQSRAEQSRACLLYTSKRTISAMRGPGSLNHNRRSFTAENVDPKRSSLNVVYRDEPIQKVYHELFDEAVKRYNAKQKRKDRCITDYYEHLWTGKQEKLFHELIVQIGNKDDMGVLTENGALAKELLDEYMQGFQERNPTLRVFGAFLHMDEATPHLHIDFVPYVSGWKGKGLDTKVSLKQALKALGFTGGSKRESELNQWIRCV